MNARRLFTIVALFSVASMHARLDDCCQVTSCYSPRSQGRDKTRQVVGSVGHTHLNDMESWYGALSVMFEYTRSFRSEHIAECLFGCSLLDDCDCPCPDNARLFKVQGCTVDNRDPRAWLADYFYLPQDFKSTISVEPRIQNFLIDLDLYLGLDEWRKGLYFRIYGPITHTRWDLDFNECVEDAGNADHAAGYFTAEVLKRDNMLDNFTNFITGCETIAGIEDFTFQPLKYAKMDKCKRTDTGFADLRFELGWNFWQTDRYHVGVNVQGAAPTGGKKQSCYLFDALVGNGNHWEAGLGATAHYILWQSEDEEQHIGVYLDANVTHLFQTCQQRTFDLCGKPNSRYMLAAKMTQEVEDDLGGCKGEAFTAARAQFAKEYAPVANISTLDSKVSIGVQGDVVGMLNFTRGGLSWDIGYNFWGRSCEDIECPDKCEERCPCPSSLCDINQERMWVLKGDAHMFGFFSGDSVDSLALSASQSKAVICKGTNGKDKKQTNDNVDRPQGAVRGGSISNDLYQTPSLNNQIKTSIQPVFLTCDDLNLQETSGTTHKLFTHVSYTWWDRENWIPFIGIGAFAEFGKTVNDCKPCCTVDCCSAASTCQATDSCCPECIDCSLSQWGVWVKGGFSFS